MRYDVIKFLKEQNGGDAMTSPFLMAANMGTKTSGTGRGVGLAFGGDVIERLASAVAPAISTASTISRVEPILSVTFLIY